MTAKRVSIFIGLAGVAAGVVLWLGLGADEPPVEPAPPSTELAQARAPQTPRAALTTAAPQGAAPTAATDDAERLALIEHVQAEYGQHIEHAYMQMRLVEFLMRYFQKHRPDDWRDAITALIRDSFPEFADEILALLDDRVEYQAWMESNRARLQTLDAETRRDELWQTRERLFGAEDAAEIWASERRNRAVDDALVMIDSADGASVLDKLSMYRDSLSDIYGDELDRFLSQHRHRAMTRFIDLDTVQATLSALPPDSRQDTLRDIRREMGLDETAIERWDELDSTRDQRWANGLEYMAARAELTAAYQGEQLETRLHELRERYFGDQADAIRSEEQSGVFRFERERRWGRN